MLFINIIFDVAIFGISIPAIFFAVSKTVDGLFQLPKLDSIFLIGIGILLICAGFVFITWAYYFIACVGKGYTLEFFGKNLLPATERLVDKGPYSIVRHPMSLGYLAMLAGVACATGSISGICIIFPSSALIAGIYLLLFEERMLDERFKEEYKAYRSHVCFIIPCFKCK